MKPSFEIKEKIRDAVDIVDLVSRYVPSLQRKGRIYVGRCPWHDDSRPSLQVNPDRQTYKCWVCDLGGDIFSFVEQIEHVEFKEAMEILADMAGITIPKYTPKTSRFAPENNSASVNVDSGFASLSDQQFEVTKPVLYKSLEWLSEMYHQYFLTSPEAENARQYIKERGISSEMVEQFKIGCSPFDSEILLNWIENNRNRIRVLIDAGILAVSHTGSFSETGEITLSNAERLSLYDRFHGRVLFPIRDTQERTVAFGGRIIPNSSLNSPAKYINSPETSVFFKSKMFYGLDRARNAIRKKKRVIITEGYTDTIIAHQFGFEETVAVLGTALGAEHVKILNRFADKIYLVLDGDTAGRKRAEEVLGFFVAQGADMSILTLPNNNDPCEYLLANGAESFENQIAQHSVPALDHALNYALDGIDLTNIVESSRALDSLLATIALAPVAKKLQRDPSQIRISQILQRISERFRIGKNDIRERLRIHRNAQNRSLWDPQSPVLPAEEKFRKHDSDNPRTTSIIPLPQFDDETDEMMISKFGEIPADIWHTPSFLPTKLEIEFFTLWWTCPKLFPEMASEVTLEDFVSPISRQVFLLGIDLISRGVENISFNTILRRYEDPAVITCLDEIAESGTKKRLSERLVSEKNQRILLRQVLDGFQRMRIDKMKPGQIGDLKGDLLDEQKKDEKLLELQKLLNEKQRRQAEQTGLMDENGPASDEPRY